MRSSVAISAGKLMYVALDSVAAHNHEKVCVWLVACVGLRVHGEMQFMCPTLFHLDIIWQDCRGGAKHMTDASRPPASVSSARLTPRIAFSAPSLARSSTFAARGKRCLNLYGTYHKVEVL